MANTREIPRVNSVPLIAVAPPPRLKWCGLMVTLLLVGLLLLGVISCSSRHLSRNQRLGPSQKTISDSKTSFDSDSSSVGSPSRGLRYDSFPEEISQRGGAEMELKRPPWQLWENVPIDNPDLDLGLELELRGDVQSAVRVYRRLETSLVPDVIREEAFVRRLSALLKLGASKTVLTEIRDFLEVRGRQIEDAPAVLAFFAAFAYEGEGDSEQALAWFSMAYRQAGVRSRIASRIDQEVRYIVSQVESDEQLDNLYRKWSSDALVGSVISEEKLSRARRIVEIIPNRNQERPDWFNSETYKPSLSGGSDSGSGSFSDVADQGQLADSELLGSTVSDRTGDIRIGALLPLSGQYAQAAAAVKNGIDLAFDEMLSTGQASIYYFDTKADPLLADKGYEELVKNKGVQVILGPMLVSCTESVARLSPRVGVPIVSFAKRAGIPELSPSVFRLGVTAVDQARDLVDYIVDKRGLTKVAVVYQRGNFSDEMRQAFTHFLTKRGGTVVADIPTDLLEQASVSSSIRELLYLERPDAIFLADSIEKSALMVKELDKSDLADVQLLGAASWYDPILLAGSGSLVDGLVFVTPFFQGSSRHPVVDFLAGYRVKYDSDAGLLSAQAFDAANLLISVIKEIQRGGKLSPDSVQQGLFRVDVQDSVTGHLRVLGSGEISRSMEVIQMVGGELLELSM